MKKVELKNIKDRVAREFKWQKHREVSSLIKKRHSRSEEKNLLAFTAHIFDSLTDYHFIRGLGPEGLYQMTLIYYRFFTGASEPLNDPCEDLPQAAISVFNPSDAPECQEIIKHLELEATVIQVYTADGPFVFESIWNYLKKKGIHIFNAIHPVIPVSRKNGKVMSIHETLEKGEKEVFLNIYIEKIVNQKNQKKVKSEIACVLRALFLAIQDFPKMMELTTGLAHREKSKKCSAKEKFMNLSGEEESFLQWLCDNNFIFMGIQRYDVKKKGTQTTLLRDDSVKLGVFRDTDLMDVVFPGQVLEIEQRLININGQGSAIVMDFFSTSASTIYHFDPIDFICIVHKNQGGTIVSKTLLFGRFSRGAKFQKASHLPILREKIGKLINAGEKQLSSWYKRELFTVFNQISKRELFYLNPDELQELIELVLSVQSDENVGIYVKNDPQDCYLSLFVIMSRGKYSRPIRDRIKEFLPETLKYPLARWEAVDCFSNTMLAFYLDTRHGKKISLDVEEMESAIKSIISTWEDRLTRRLVVEYGDRSGFAFYNKYREAFSGLYREITDIERAILDVHFLEKLEKNSKPCINIFQSNASSGEVELKIYSLKEIDLMTIIPTAQNLGLYVSSEQVLPLKIKKDMTAYIHIFKVCGEAAFLQNILDRKVLLSEILIKIMDRETVNDRLNQLVLKAGFNWKAIELLRALKSYLLQINFTFSPGSIDDVLVNFADITKNIFSYFEAKFKPEKKKLSVKKMGDLLVSREKEFEDSLAQISSLMDDQISRGIFDIVKNTLRTNYYKSPNTNYISFKIDCRSITKMPSPRPLYEIYVHSPELEGVHLRGGKVARGGLRWSDRYDDFRTEILGLMKTQMVKNTVIVPFGSKGGFVLKQREFKGSKERDAYVKKQYQTFICGLLDLTDNIKGGNIYTPKNVAAYDEHDPYLVVAADKGTAKLSDAANEISEKYNFWLGDAFASGGAVGYDHKKEGITARGAWECVKRHFRELGVNIQNESIRVAGIGDMGGDVFGNGMLLSRKIKLVAAFNHIHIFLDPDPDPEKSWKERKRLFENPRLTWMDYSQKLISKGGGIHARNSKSISLSPEAKKMLGIQKDGISGEELIRSILTMDMDLLWNGGIGTYVKSSRESHLDVGDRSNDRVRVDSKKLKAKVIGEGGNLGITQLGRIEVAAKGVICNTDAIDNSGGVDMSDHEVNIKILLSTLMENGEIQSKKERDELFIRVTDEVAELVLKDNYLQSAAISMDRIRSNKRLDPFLDMIERLASLSILNQKEEFIPAKEELIEGKAKNKGILRPILSVLLGYAKMNVYKEILHSKLIDTVFVERYLNNYFPDVFHREYSSYIKSHRLKREIISTVITNKIINQSGMIFFSQIEERTGKTSWEIARAYIILENMLNADKFRSEVYELDNAVSSELQYRMLIDMETVLFQLTEWMLSNMEEDRISFDLINLYQGIIENFQKNLVSQLETVCSLEKGCLDKKVQNLTGKGVPRELAETYSVLPYFKDIMAILMIKEELHYNFIDTGNLYIKLNHYLSLDWIQETLSDLDLMDEWEEKAEENLNDELKDYQNRIVINILNFKRHDETIGNGFDSYMKEKKEADENFRNRVTKIKEENNATLVSLSVLVRSLKEFL